MVRRGTNRGTSDEEKHQRGPTERLEKQTADRRRAERVMGADGEEKKERKKKREKKRGAAEHQRHRPAEDVSRRVRTHVDHVGHVVDVVLGHHGVGGRQVQQVVVAGLGAFELVLRVLGLPLERGDEREQMTGGGGGRKPSVQEEKQTHTHTHTLG